MFRVLKPQVSVGAGSLVIGNGNEVEGGKCSDGVVVEGRWGGGQLIVIGLFTLLGCWVRLKMFKEAARLLSARLAD